MTGCMLNIDLLSEEYLDTLQLVLNGYIRVKMLWSRRVVFYRIGFVLLLLTLYLIYKKFSRPKLEYGPRPTRKELETYPIYEYTSFYRLQSDIEFENSLDQKLISIERAARAFGSETIISNHTIWQFASADEKRMWSTWAAQWDHMNPDWTHHVFMSPPDDLLDVYRSVPEIMDTMKAVLPIRKDLLRYLLLWYYGGLYASINTWSRFSLKDCEPVATALQNLSIGLMIGVHVDEPYLSPRTISEWGWLRGFKFSQDVVWAPRRFNPLLRTAIVRTISHTRTQQAIGRSLGIGYATKTQILEEISGAAMFTDIVLEFLSAFLSADNKLRDPDAGISRRVTWKYFSRLKKPIWIKGENRTESYEIPGLAVLPVHVWSNGQAHSHAGSDSVEDACINQLHNVYIRKTWLG
ncbi:Initiation-specific alpha-1,6-mannosyltransferase [Golovinomyces cichoracearum]|uniref:Initiation-specific alpha-1,6-mannosyltransferase n=1 Tax=Golovinomyces cichoracearum TaxID=62708 RepID=A0A420ISN1_9PEZI|nr:Initiation-specific alpha-1,6-mannosyltransferase [Golovinomyces cichoracearum]